MEAMKGTRLKHDVKSLYRNDPKRKSLECVDQMSWIFLHLPIDCLGYLNNTLFELAMHKYLGLSCPILRGFEGYYFDKMVI